MTYRILKEQLNPAWAEGDPLIERTKFLPTGDTYDDDDPQAHIEALQAEFGGCYAAEKVQPK